MDKQPERKPFRRHLRLSLGGLLSLSAVVFVVGYQQYQIHQLHREVLQLRTVQRDLRKSMDEVGATNTVIFTPGVNKNLRFPIEVERAMMGDSAPDSY